MTEAFCKELNDIFTQVSRCRIRLITKNSFHFTSCRIANEKMRPNFGSAHIEKPQRNISFTFHLFSQVSALLFQ